MPLQVYSSRIALMGADPDALDVSRSGAAGMLLLAPSHHIARVLLAEIRRARSDYEYGSAVDRFTRRYIDEMRHSRGRNREAWDDLLRRPRAVLVCHCKAHEPCHRGILRELILPGLGAIDCGEITGEEGSLRARTGSTRGHRVA